jgi:hypothetical protein
MPLPEPFNAVEHLQMTARMIQNQRVREFFRDLSWSEDGVPDLDINTPRGSLMVACWHDDNDPILITILRILLFFLVLGYEAFEKVYYLGSVNDEDAVEVSGHPKVNLYFSQDPTTVAVGERAADMEISFRLMQYTQATFNETVAKEIAKEIKAQFTSNKQGVLHDKGNLRVMMIDPVNGFTRKSGILSKTESDGTEIYKKIYNVIDKTFEEENITVNNPKRASSTNNRGTHTVYGKQVEKPAYRRETKVRFRYAYVVVPNLKNPIFLVDTELKRDALEYS